ncbi:DUF3887 domain-containing protein [Streptomyces sp. ISL-43]|uniref:DUF3887 domain-containing protein n=1 Tax=Streptomyces sp. ISL-43 TaxID=2819183 RepID=UPI001BE60822|nr:DUF3887 domain-containing protein [Streptomyces sp. ISL-43]MBT2447098.1 DUF3887 domain-containing protein [Streptomyces sp. ISL-43]
MDVSGATELEKAVVLMPEKDATPRSRRQLAQAAAAVTLATCTLLPANGFAWAAMQAHATTTVAGPAAASPAQTRYDRIAIQTLNDIVNGDITAATARFDATTRELLPPDALAGAWATYQDTFGRYRSHGDPKAVTFGEFTVVNVPLRMERGPGEFRVTFHEDGSIAGLWFLEPGVPIS